ncbi:MacS family sensor histidine kinase [Mariniluteicoccus flavus]
MTLPVPPQASRGLRQMLPQRLGQPDPRAYAGPDPIEPFFRVLGHLRWLALGLTITMDVSRLHRALHPPLVIAVCVAMTVTTVVLTVVSARKPHRRRWLAWAEVAIGFALAFTTLVAMPPDLRVPPITAFWLAAGGLAVVLACGWVQGMIAATLLSVALLVVAPTPAVDRWGLALVLIAAAGGLGWTIDVIRASILERMQVQATNAALAERQRLARIVHDGVLQVLAMVEREGRHLGPRGAMLARSAHQQEVALRALIQETDIDPNSRDPRDVTHRNFAVLLDRHASHNVSVATPVEPLLMESARATELDAAVAEALNNVAKHAGPQAKAWVFLEIDGNEATVSVRDNGVGGDPNQFALAMQSGRMGMKHSIYGRIHELGGTATLRAAPGRGVEWEFRVPIEL